MYKDIAKNGEMKPITNSESNSEENNIKDKNNNSEITAQEKDEKDTAKFTTNPKTGDNITIWISLMLLSILGIERIVKFIKKNK